MPYLARCTPCLPVPRVIPLIIAPFWSGCKSTIIGLGFFLMSCLSWQAADDAALGCRDAGMVQPSSKIPPISRVVNIANTAAMSLLAR